MKIAYFDCFSGISGDMAVGALIDAGVPLEVVKNGLAMLSGLPDTLRYEIRPIVRSAVHAVKFDVLNEQGSPVDRGLGENPDPHGHSHAHHHHHDHSHSHDHGHHHDHSHASYAGIARMIAESSLSEGVKARAIGIFHAIAVGEARVHNMPLEEVHFHEVGAYDSIADIVAVAICLDYLGVEGVSSSPIPLGSGGMIRTQHGVMPLPAPATLEILKDYPVRLTNVPFELTTPTGAGIIRALSRGTLEHDLLRVERVGFGAGTRELPDRPNLLRVVIGTLGEEEKEREERDTAVLMEANVDDLNPQVWPYVVDRLLEEGALDAWLTPVLMKKGRPAHVISVLAVPERVDAVAQILWRETTTIGVRYSQVSRRKLKREEVVVPTRFGPVRMKLVEGSNGKELRPEADEAARIAREHSLPLRDVLEELSHLLSADNR